MLRRGPVVGVCAFAALTLGAASCGSSSGSSSVTASGTTLTIYASAPAGSPAAPDILDAERLAFEQFRQGGARIGKFTIRFVATVNPKVSDNARTAIADSGAIAYIGELTPGASAGTMGITNAEDVLQVSPADTALELTQSTTAVPGAPTSFYESHGTYGSTFARVVPNTAQEARAQVQEMSALGVRKVYVTDDGSDYGAAVALAVKQAAGTTITAVQGPPQAARFQASGADAVFYGAASASYRSVASLFEAVAHAAAGVKLFAPSALDTASFAATLGTAPLRLYVSAPGFLPKDLPAQAQPFVSAFKSAYGHVPAQAAIFGYEAVDAVVAVLKEAGVSANNRATVVRDFFAIKNRSSVLGTYSITSTGDISLAPFVFSRLRAGKLVPFVQAQG